MAPPGSDVLRRVLVLLGPTACGKTALALQLAEHCSLEVVSADSRTVYRWMDVGTAKPTPVERARVPHHLLDVVDPDEDYSLAMYQQQALAAISRIAARGPMPLLVGGAGLYIRAVCDGLRLPSVAPDPFFRARMEARAAAAGWPALQAELARVDPASAAQIDPRNVRRVIRALEVQHASGVPFSAWQRRSPPPFTPVFVGLEVDRPELNGRIDARIDAWLAAGFMDEVQRLLARGYGPSLPSMSGIGYRELAAVARGELTLDQARSLIKHATRQYARRQMTWFRRDERIRWLRQPRPEEVLELVSDGP
ncbi:MAG: tRNA (adenosine(37)-N6)-dimethylallyltransferase MiaA [Chloroflexota bacterium]|nr:tRNA (adenosine(37)-N6)-dimethylallyltransferase MiaA [Chloroflexota bacterium]